MVGFTTGSDGSKGLVLSTLKGKEEEEGPFGGRDRTVEERRGALGHSIL